MYNMQGRIEKFITLGNKAKVLLKQESELEPRVNILINPEGKVTYTFNSSCFPFFSENGFETVDESGVDLFLEKCELYVSNLEKSQKMEFDKPEVERETLQPIKPHKKATPTKSSFLIKYKDRKLRITTRVCPVHRENITHAFRPHKDYTCYGHRIQVEELEN